MSVLSDPSLTLLTSSGLDAKIKALLRGDSHELDAFLTNVAVNVEILNTKASVHCYIISLDGNKRPRVKDLAHEVALRIVEYAIPRSEIIDAQEYDKKHNTTVRTTELVTKAKMLFTKLSNTGEGGELLLYMLIQSCLRIPQLLCKMPLKTSAQVHYHGIDGIHAAVDKKSKKLALYWGESKLYNSLDKAIAACLDSIKPFLCDEGITGSAQDRDLHLIRSNIDLNDRNLEEALLRFLDPKDPHFKKLQYRGACLVGFDDNAYPLTPNIKDEEDVLAEVQAAFHTWINKLRDKITKRTPLETFVLEIFLIPFPSVKEFRVAFLKEIS